LVANRFRDGDGEVCQPLGLRGIHAHFFADSLAKGGRESFPIQPSVLLYELSTSSILQGQQLFT
jgi:hypothetical protein